MLPPILLCVDDRPRRLELLKASLEPLGYSVLSASSAPAAMSVVDTTAVAAVLVESKLEEMDAEVIAFEVKQRLPNQPVILLSACSETPEHVLWLVDEFVWSGEPPQRLAEILEQTTRPFQAA